MFEYTYDIVHCPDIKNVIPDTLSRLFPDEHLKGSNNVISADINNINSKKKGKSAFNEKSESNDKRAQTVTHAPQIMLHRALQYEDLTYLLLRKDVISSSRLTCLVILELKLLNWPFTAIAFIGLIYVKIYKMLSHSATSASSLILLKQNITLLRAFSLVDHSITGAWI